MFPPIIILMPGPGHGRVRLPETPVFSYYRPDLGANTWSKRGGRYSLMIEAGESGVMFSFDRSGDSLVGSARHYTDAASAPQPTMRAIAEPMPCSALHLGGLLPNTRLKLSARVDWGMNLSSARRSLSAFR